MKIATRYTFFLLLFTAGAGLFMRALPYLPVQVDYTNLRHAHSHLAFLGWIYAAFFLAFVHFFLRPESFAAHFRELFWLTQVSVAGMLVSFLVQGYGPFSIGFLTVHTLLAYRFIWKFWKLWQPDWQRASTWFSASALLFFVLSTLGPFAIPPIQILGGGNPLWMKMAVHYYLHFQYNGWFIYGVMALLFKVMENRNIAWPQSWTRWQFGLMFTAVFPAYFVTLTSSALPGWTANLATAGVWLQWTGYALFSYYFLTKKIMRQVAGGSLAKFILGFALSMLFVKFTFEIIGATPPFSGYFAPFSQYLIIGYLHLVFLGAVTPFLWWVNEKAGLFTFRNVWAGAGAVIYTLGFAGSEVALIMFGLNLPLPQSTLWLLIFSGLMFFGAAVILYVILSPAKIDSLMTESKTLEPTLQPEFSER
jgi:hypothetical protein